jgi:hypothetical protein
VELRESGFGKRYYSIEVFDRSLNNSIYHGIGRHDHDVDYVRFCFSDPQHAKSFANLFGGEIKRAAPPGDLGGQGVGVTRP